MKSIGLAPEVIRFQERLIGEETLGSIEISCPGKEGDAKVLHCRCSHGMGQSGRTESFRHHRSIFSISIEAARRCTSFM
jgi:hypothetical protein